MPIGETYPQSLLTEQIASEGVHSADIQPDDRRAGLRSLARTAGLGAAALGISFGVVSSAAAEQPPGWVEPPAAQALEVQDIQTTKMLERQRKKAVARCEAQKEQDKYQYSSCEYQGAYAAIVKKFPTWTANHKLSAPGREDITDRKKAYFKTHPLAYKQYRFDTFLNNKYMGNVAWVRQCYKWADEANVPLNDDAIKLLDRESDCNPSAMNDSSGAGGIPQALPFSKTGCKFGPSGAICQIKWFYNYSNNTTYDSYSEALGHSDNYGWY